MFSSVSGVAYKTEIETVKENIVSLGELDLGASSNVVMRLALMTSKHQNFVLYFDNYFTYPPLLEYLARERILSHDTVTRS